METGIVNLIANRVGEDVRVCKRDVPKQVASSLDKVCVELGKVYKYLDGKPNVEYLLSLVGAYHIMKLDGSELPDRTPEDIIREDLVPFFNSVEYEVMTNEEGYDVANLNEPTEDKVS